jgi:hypothetical protein
VDQFAAAFQRRSLEVAVPMDRRVRAFSPKKRATVSRLRLRLTPSPQSGMRRAKADQSNGGEAQDQDTAKARRPSHLQIIK